MADEPIKYEVIGRSFEAKFPGHCAVVYPHKIKVGMMVARVRRADNPMLPVPGVACTVCVKLLPRGKT